jgi:hypothetical protein
MTTHIWSRHHLKFNIDSNLNFSLKVNLKSHLNFNFTLNHKRMCVTTMSTVDLYLFRLHPCRCSKMVLYLSQLHLHPSSRIWPFYPITGQSPPTAHLQMHHSEKQRLLGYSRKKLGRPSVPNRIGILKMPSSIPELPIVKREQVSAERPVKQQVKPPAKLQVEHQVEPAANIRRASTPEASSPIQSHSRP